MSTKRTLKSGALAYAQAAAIVSILGTTVVGLTQDEGYKDPERIVGAIANLNNAAAGAVIYGAQKFREKKPLLGGLTPSETATTRERATTSAQFNMELEANPEWYRFFTGDNYTGTQAFVDYIDVVYGAYKGNEKALKKMLTLKEFMKYLEKTGKTKILARLKKTLVEGKKTEDETIQTFAKAFKVFAIGGERVTAEASFHAAMHNTDIATKKPTA